MDTDVVQLRTGARLVTDITQVIIEFCASGATGCVMSSFRMPPLASH